MSSQIGLLQDNFQEIYHAVHSSEQTILPLVANLSGTRIYDARYGWGRLWLVVYQALSLIYKSNLRLEKLKASILYTHELFHQQAVLIDTYANAYLSYLVRAGKEYEMDENEMHQGRRLIVEWCSATSPFIKMMRHLEHPRMQRLLNLCFGTASKASTPFFHPSLPIIEACRRVVDLEGMTHGPLPLGPLKKAIKGKPLNLLDQKNLDDWIQTANRVKNFASRFHKGICHLSEIYNKGSDKKENTSLNGIALEAFLEDRGCTVFQQEDVKQKLWRSLLRKGSEVSNGKGGIILGDELESTHASFDPIRVFSIEAEPQNVCLIAQNRVSLFIKGFRHSKKYGCGVEPAPLKEIAHDGRYAIMERLQRLDNRAWKTSSDKIADQDAPVLGLICQLLKWFVENNLSLAGFSAESVMIDSSNQLKSLRPLPQEAFNFNALETFAFQCAQGNRYIFRYLMEHSGLSAHPAAKFYREALANALKGDQVSVEDLAGIFKIEDPKVVDHGIELACEAIKLHRRILAKVKKLFPAVEAKLLHKKISLAILTCHRDGGGIFWPSLEQEALNFACDNK